MSLLVVENLAAGHQGAVFADVGFAVQPGEFVGLLGPNGAGKSTLLRAISGALPPRSGRVLLEGRELRALKSAELARRLAFLPQTPPPDLEFAVREVVAFGRHPYQQGWHWGEDEADRRAIEEAMAATGVTDWATRRMGTLSGGEQQRVRMAQAVAQAPALLLLDEPTAWADLNYQLELLRLCAQLARARQLAVIAVLHDLNQAAQFCSRLLILHHGHLAADGPPLQTLTEEAIMAAYGVAVHVRHHPQTGAPFVLPRMAITPVRQRHRKLHVVAGGGSASSLLPRLHALGYELSVGALNALDSDLELATELGIPAIAEAPFAPISAETEELLRARLLEVDEVVVAGMSFGPGNVANLRAVAQSGRKTYLVGRSFEGRDYTGGEATRWWDTLVAQGALACEEEELLRRLAATGSLA